MNRHAVALVHLVFTAFVETAGAASHSSICTLPVPDGADKTPSPANVDGRVSRAGKDFVDVTPHHGQRPVHVEYTDETQFYTAFGGDYEPKELAVGQHVSVWFVDCKPAKSMAGRAAYLQLYSKDPTDQPR